MFIQRVSGMSVAPTFMSLPPKVDHAYVECTDPGPALLRDCWQADGQIAGKIHNAAAIMWSVGLGQFDGEKKPYIIAHVEQSRGADEQSLRKILPGDDPAEEKTREIPDGYSSIRGEKAADNLSEALEEIWNYAEKHPAATMIDIDTEERIRL